MLGAGVMNTPQYRTMLASKDHGPVSDICVCDQVCIIVAGEEVSADWWCNHHVFAMIVFCDSRTS